MSEFLVVDHLNLKEIARVFSRVIVTEGGCWQWTGTCDKGGYGRIRFRNTAGMPVHRLVYAWAVGPIPKGQGKDIPNLDHVVCDNESCCNPIHLELALPRDNTLRGNGLTAQNARKTHCKYGHLLPAPQIGPRNCSECVKVIVRRRQERRANDPDYAVRVREYWRNYDLKRGKVKQKNGEAEYSDTVAR